MTSPNGFLVSAVLGGDLHYTHSAWKYVPKAAGAAAAALRYLVDLANQYDVPLVLAGDVFDSPRPPPGVVIGFVREVARLQHPLLYIDGNHDDQSRATWPKLAANTVSLDGVTETLAHSVRIHGVRFRPPWSLKAALVETKFDTDFLLMHQEWREIAGSRAANTLMDVQIQSPSWIVTGDWHKYVEWIRPDGVQVLSPGSLHPMSLDEPPEKYAFLLGRAATTQELSYRRVPVPSRRILLLHAASADQLAAAKETVSAIPPEDTPALIRLRHTPDLDVKAFVKEFDSHILFVEPARGLHDVMVRGADRPDQMVTVEDVIDRDVPDTALAELAKALYRTPSDQRANTLAEYRKRVFAANGVEC